VAAGLNIQKQLLICHLITSNYLEEDHSQAPESFSINSWKRRDEREQNGIYHPVSQQVCHAGSPDQLSPGKRKKQSRTLLLICALATEPHASANVALAVGWPSNKFSV